MSTLTLEKPTTQLADIFNLKILSVNNSEDEQEQHHIITEWSMLPIDSFADYEDAQAYIQGFKCGSITQVTPAFYRGQFMRQCVEIELQDGYAYKKLHDISYL
jgi:hypothetical protein